MYKPLVCAFFLVACSSPKTQPQVKPEPTPSPKSVVVEAAPMSDLAKYTEHLDGEDLHVKIETTLGLLDCDLFESRAPKTVTNFVGLATGQKTWVDPDSGSPIDGRPYYDDAIFHRVVPGFFAQSGDPTGTGNGGPGYRFEDEFHPDLRHDGAGVLSMANKGPNTNGGQFFVLTNATPHLDGHHSVFGKCAGEETISKLNTLPVDSNDRPVDPPSIKSIEIYAK